MGVVLETHNVSIEMNLTRILVLNIAGGIVQKNFEPIRVVPVKIEMFGSTPVHAEEFRHIVRNDQ